MKVVFMGTPDFATETLKSIKEKGHEIAMVVTQPDRPVKRSSKPVFSPVKEMAVEYGLPVLQPEKAKDGEFIEQIRDIGPDVIVVVAYGQIISKELLDIPKYGCVNVHASLLPKYRGASPIQWAVINGDEYSGVTTMLMDVGLDSGDILLTEKVKLDENETGGSLFDKLSTVGADLLIKTLKGLEENSIKPVPQDESKVTHVSMLSKSMGEIDFNKDASAIERLIRGLNPWPSAFTYYNGKKITIWEADVIEDGPGGEEPGTIIKTEKNAICVKCGTGALKIKQLQPEGKKRMDTSAFLNGNNIKEGDIFGKK